MKDQRTVLRFIELRSAGVSFARIAEQLGVAKSTLINWSREHQHLIQNLRAIEWEDFVDRIPQPGPPALPPGPPNPQISRV
jgi:hypothetical protein